MYAVLYVTYLVPYFLHAVIYDTIFKPYKSTHIMTNTIHFISMYEHIYLKHSAYIFPVYTKG